METPTIDHAGLARSLGVWSEGPLTDMASVRSALARAVEVVRAGEPAVVEVRTSPR
jgi:benzoylformate decarboxylase/acetolactate synthase-1/2/3 large subunit